MHSVHQHRATSRYGRTVQYIKWISFTSSQVSWRLVKIKSKNKSSSHFFLISRLLWMWEKKKKNYEIFLLFIYRSLFLSSNLFVVMFDRFRTRSRREVGILWLGWNVLLLWSEQYDGMTIYKCWALSSLIFYLFFVFCFLFFVFCFLFFVFCFLFILYIF